MTNWRYFLFYIFVKRLEYTHIKSKNKHTIILLSKKTIPEYCKGDHPWINDRLQGTDDHDCIATTETEHIRRQKLASLRILVSLSHLLIREDVFKSSFT